MGLFSKTRHVIVQSQSFNIVNEKTFHKLTQASVLESVLLNHPITDVIKENIFSGGGLKLKNFIRWADTSGYNKFIGEIFPSLTYVINASASEICYIFSEYISDWKDSYSIPEVSPDYKDNIVPIFFEAGEWDATKQAVIYGVEQHPERFQYLVDVFNDRIIENTLDLPLKATLDPDNPKIVHVKWYKYTIHRNPYRPEEDKVVNSGSFPDETYDFSSYELGSKKIWVAAFHLRTTRTKVGHFDPSYNYSTEQTTLFKTLDYPTGDAFIDSFYGKQLSGSEALSKFASVIPLRYWNHSINPENDKDTYAWCQKAVKRLFGNKDFYQDCLDSVNKMQGIDNIDFAYMHLGVPINKDEKEALAYIFNFFDVMYNMSDPRPIDLLDVKNKYMLVKNYRDHEGQHCTDTEKTHDKSTGTMPGLRNGMSLQLRTGATANYNYNVTYSWDRLLRVIHRIEKEEDYPKDKNGKKRVKGDYWREPRKNYTGTKLVHKTTSVYENDHPVNKEYYVQYTQIRPAVTFYKMVTDSAYQEISVFGLGMTNNIFENYSDVLSADVEIDPATYTKPPYYPNTIEDGWEVDSLEQSVFSDSYKKNRDKAIQNQNTNNGYSAFIIPIELHAARNTSLVKFTDASQYSATMLFNMYEVYYTGGFWSSFGGFLGGIMAVIGGVISIAFPPASPVLGFAVSMMTGLGITIVTMTIDNPILTFAGQVLSTLAAGVSSYLVAIIAVSSYYVVSTVIPGPIGKILGSIASIVISTNLGFDEITNEFTWENSFADNIIDKLSDPRFVIEHLTSATGSILQAYIESVNKDTLQVQEETRLLQEKYNSKSKELKDAAEAYLGSDNWMSLIAKQANINSIFSLEPPENFLSRTLLNGEDVADITIKTLEKMPELTLDLDYLYT